jgi:hypothetical protein
VPGERFEAELETEQPGFPSKRVAVVVDERGLVVDGKIECARETFLGGGLENLTTHYRVLVVSKSDDPALQRFWFFRAPDRGVAEALLRAAGLDAESGALELRTTGGGWSIEGTILPAVAASLTLLGFLLWSTKVGVGLLIAGLGAIFAATVDRPIFSRVDLRIGTDGVLHTQLWRSRFSPFTSIRRVWAIGSRVAMQLVDGSVVVLKYDGPTSREPPAQMTHDRAIVELIKMRVLDGIERGIAATDILRQDFEVARGAREVRAWLDELRKLKVAMADYRTAPKTEVDLDTLFADGSLDTQTRLGAAIALRARHGDEAAPRLRIGARATASPHLRSAFEQIAEGSFEDDIAERIAKIK